MILKHQWLSGIVLLVVRWSAVESRSLDLDVILHEYAIVNDREVRRRHHLAILTHARCAEENVIALPLTRFAARVHKRNVLFVNACRLSIRVSPVVVRVQDLNLVVSLKKYSAVASLLSVAFDLCRSPPLDVKLTIAESALRLDIARAFHNGGRAFRNFPLRRSSISLLPLGKILSIE